MSKKTAIVLAVLNAALLAFILLFERGTLSTGDVEGRRGQLLERFVRERVERVELSRADEEPIVFVRERAEDEELGTWRIAAPIEAEADDDAVDSLLSALEWAAPRRTLTTVTAEDRTQFGLDEPRLSVRFTVGDEVHALAIGGDAPTGEGVYAAVEGQDRAYVVGEDLIESLDHDVSHFRKKELFADFYTSDARTIRLAGDGLVFELEKADGVWRVRAPVSGWANRGLVDGVLRALGQLRATRFVAEAPEDLSEYGLDAPWRALTVTRPEDASGATRAELIVGATCGEHEDERYARAGDGDEEGPVVCVMTSDVAPLEVDAERLREPRLLTVTDDAIEAVTVEEGARRLVLRRAESTWELVVGDAGEPVQADDQAIAAWLGELRALRAVAFEPIEGDAPGHGLGSPRATLTVRRTDQEEPLVLRLGEVSGDGAWVRRGDEAAAVRFGPEAAERMTPPALRFRDRALVDAEPANARAVTLRDPDAAEERAVRGEGGAWQLEAPIEAEADRVGVREAARQIAGLTAARFVAASPSAEHGLASPSRVLTVRFEPERFEPERLAPDEPTEGDAADAAEARTVTLRIGAETVEGAYAQLGEDGPVFEIARDVLAALPRSLVSLDLLTVPTEDLASLRIERGGETFALEREGGRWQVAGGGTPDPDRTSALLDRLSTLRASGVVGYGEPTGALGLSPPAVRVVATRREGVEGPATITLELGAEQGEGDEAYVPARRTDVGVIYRFRPELVDVLRTYHP